eukprot:1954311-Rhodomonas_salina.1
MATLKEQSLWYVDSHGGCIPVLKPGTMPYVSQPAAISNASESFPAISRDVIGVAREMRQNIGAEGWIMLVLANKAFGELTKNWVCNLKRLGLENRL